MAREKISLAQTSVLSATLTLLKSSESTVTLEVCAELGGFFSKAQKAKEVAGVDQYFHLKAVS